MKLLIPKSLVSNLSPTMSSLVWVSPSEWHSFIKGCTEIDSTSCLRLDRFVLLWRQSPSTLYMLLFLSYLLAHSRWHTWHLSQQFETCELLIRLWLRLVIHCSNNVCIISVSVCTFFSKLKLTMASLVLKYNRVLSHKNSLRKFSDSLSPPALWLTPWATVYCTVGTVESIIDHPQLWNYKYHIYVN